MKEKKNTKLRKALLMMTSVVLVAAVSVGATLAYLTAQTSPIKNEFKSKSDIQGKVIEPTFTTDKSMSYKPGKAVPKDPRIDNDTNGKQIYAGIELEFFFKIGDDYTHVDYTDFIKFVDIDSLPSFTSDKASGLSADGSGVWHYINTKDGKLYFLYDKKLEPNDQDSGTGMNAGDDTSAYIFSNVTVKKELTIKEGGKALATTDYDDAEDTPLANTYSGFDFKIKITGYGVTTPDDAADIAAARTTIIGLMGVTAA